MKKWVIILIFILIILGVVFGIYYFNPSQKQTATPSSSSSPTPKKQITIVALGDSLTKAANPSPELIGDQPEYSYACGDKIESLAKLKEKEGYEVNCYNLAESGARSDQVLKQQVPEAVDYQPDFVVMTVGGNDATGGVSTAVFKENVAKIIDNFPNSKILIGNIPNLDEFRKNNYPACSTPLTQYRELESLTSVYILTYNLVIKSLESKNVKIIDLFNLLGKEDASSYDCLHFSISGQEKTAQAFFERAKE